jgi:uncharacterized protein (TIGR02145 family)
LAQNLNYQKELEHQTNPNPAQNGAAGTGNYGTMTAANRFWCPSSNSGQNQGVETGPGNFRRGCEVFGALYTPITARMNDGNNFSTSAVPTFGTPISGVSTTASSLRGVCPPNWVLPSDYDWGVLLNYVEDNCPSPTSATDGNQRNPLVPPCNHVSTVDDSQWLGYSAGRYLKGTYTCAANEGNCAKIVSNDLSVDKWNFTSSPAWSASSYDVAGVDRFGFTVLPAGWRDGTYNSQNFKIWGEVARFVTASTQNGNVAAAYYDMTRYREFSYDRRDVQRAFSGTATANYSTHAYSVRCLRRP